MYVLDILKCTLLQSKSEVLKNALTILTNYILSDESNKKIEFLVAIFKEAFRSIKQYPKSFFFVYRHTNVWVY